MNEIVFSGSNLDRLDARRRDAEWLQAQLIDDATRILPVWNLMPLVRSDEPRLAWATPAILDDHQGPPPILLGANDGRAHFAIDISGVAEPLDQYGWEGVASFPDLRAASATLPAEDAAIAAQARHIVDWHSRHNHCPGCGAATQVRDGGWSRFCTDCSTEHFPRTDPVVIMLVTDGDRCLLGRQPGWPGNMYSALAGFVEGGEMLEEAVAREVSEEAGLTCEDVRYIVSQPWPFPASIMIGCRARATSTKIELDSHELEHADWFTRDEARAALAGATDRLMVPPPMAIAHVLLRRWVEEG
jgi:NAD+ diphosphatase